MEETERYEHRHLNVVCELTESDTATRTREWARVKDQAIATESLPQGIVMWLPAESAGLVRDLARREAQCCGYLNIEVTVRDDRVRLEIRSAVPSAAPLIEFLSAEPRSAPML